MTIIWFIVWVVANAIGHHEPLRFDPVNVWAALLILAIALDLNRPQSPSSSSARRRAASGGGSSDAATCSSPALRASS